MNDQTGYRWSGAPANKSATNQARFSCGVDEEDRIRPNDLIFQTFARAFPTRKVGRNIWGLWWRIAFYALRPSRPFIMSTAFYRLWAWPGRHTLTRAVIRRGCWEATLTELFRRHLSRGAFVVDAGANFGHFSLVAAPIVGPSGAVVAFEPHGATFRLLQANAELNACDWMTSVRAALGDAEGEAVLTSDAVNPGGHSLTAANVAAAAGTECVALHSLDAYLAVNAPHRRLDVLKIDVQGHEAQLIAGARKTLGRDRPVVFCEITPAMVRRSGRDIADVLAPFVALGYEATIVWDGAGCAQRASFETVKSYCSRTEHVDLILVPADRTTAGVPARFSSRRAP